MISVNGGLFEHDSHRLCEGQGISCLAKQPLALKMKKSLPWYLFVSNGIKL
jgi:hypothetical protein